MEKALEILKEILDTQDLSYKVVNNVCDVIKELEEAMKPKTCEGCKNLYINQYDEFSDYCKELNIEISRYTISNFCCNKHEPKDNA